MTQQNKRTLAQWLIRKLDTPSYRAGTRTGMIHPKVDQGLIREIGGREELLAQARELKNAFPGKVHVDWREMNRDIKKIEIPVELMEELCQREGVPDPRKRQLQYIAQIKELKGAANEEWIQPFYDHILERLEKGEKVQDVNRNGGPDLDDRAYFLCLNGVVNNREPVWKRVFSAAVFRSLPVVLDSDFSEIMPSKCFERKYQKRIFNLLKDDSPLYKEGMTEEELLAAHGILSYAQTLEWKGPLQYQTAENKIIDTSPLIYGTVLNAQTLDHAMPVGLPGVKRIMTIENKANYESMAYRSDTLYIFCHGFFSPKERRFLERLPQIAGEDAEYLHWGDMDYGGICIFKFIREELFPKLKPYRMDAAEFRRAVEIGSGIELKPGKRKKYEELKVAELEELKQCILEKNMEIEQEILLAEIYRRSYDENDAFSMHE